MMGHMHQVRFITWLIKTMKIIIIAGIPKLRRVLLAYSLHNPEIEYCQGFNRIAAIALLFLNEEDAFWCLVYIVEVVMPHSYYSKQLIGAQIDQEVFKELVSEKLPNLSLHLGEILFISC